MEKGSILNPDEVLQQLKAGAKTPRTQRSLDVVHQACMEQHQRGSNDFSYGMIGRLSEAKGGPKAQPIRNASGASYRLLIDAWAKFADGKTRKPPAPRVARLEDDVLSIIDDPVARILVQNYISENKKLRYENQVLKMASKETVVIDLSGPSRNSASGLTVFAQDDALLDQERAALRNAISPDTLRMQGWTIDENTGSIKKGPLSIFSPGFVTGIRKILGEAES
jgi:hypothetical protein